MPTIPKSIRRPWQPQYKPQSGRTNSNTKFYQSAVWRRLRAHYLHEHPLCVNCQQKGQINLASVVDHIVPINQGGAALDRSNLQSLCHRCHNQKSGRESHAKR